MTESPLSKIIQAMAHDGVPPSDPGQIRPNGALCRFHVQGDKSGTRNGWAVVYTDGIPAAAYGSWKHGVSATWRARQPTKPAERERNRQRMEQARQQRERERVQAHTEAARRAKWLWRNARRPDPGHGYLTAKGIGPHWARQRGQSLLLPVFGFDRRLWSVQFIDPHGGKLLLAGGKKRGCCIPVQTPPEAERVLICEGWATGCTLADLEPASLVLAAIDAGNLESVARQARERWPDADMVVCADADDTGRAQARAAAIAAGALVAVPRFPTGATGSDFNDLATLPRTEGGA